MMASKNIKRFISLLMAACFILLTFSGCGERYTEKTSFAMGSMLSVKIFAESEEQGNEIFELINSAVTQLDAAISPSAENSEIAVLNTTKNTILSSTAKDFLADCILYSNILDRRVNVAIGAVTKLWGFSTEAPSVPDKNELNNAVAAVDIEKVRIDDITGRVTIPDDMEIDPGAFGKGAACDAAFLATQYKYVPYILTLGGTVLACGNGPTDGKWTIGIRDPFSDAGAYFATLSLAPTSAKNAFFVSTSGSYEKTFIEDGKTYHHILNPKTGMPVETELVSVTVITSSGLSADALSTALFVEGLNDNSLGYIKSLSAEAIFVFRDKTYYVTDGLKDAVKITADGFRAIEYENETQTSQTS